MTAEAGECNGRSEGSKAEFEAKGGGDLKDGGIACREAEEIGGSFVIVNGDSDDHSDRDLDLEGKSDPKVEPGNGGSRWDDDEIGGKEESLGGDGANGDENHGLEDVGDVDKKLENVNLVGERSNGDEVKKEEGDLVMPEEENVIGSRSDVKEEETENENGSKLDSVEADVDRIEVEESEKVDDLDSDVRIEHEEEDAVDAAEEKQDTEVLAGAEDRDAEAVIDEGESNQELGSEFEPEGMKGPETAVLEKSELDPQVGEEQVAVSAAAEAVEGGDVESINVEENQKPVDVVGETEIIAELEPAIEAERGQEARNVVEEKIGVTELDPAFEVEAKEEPYNGTEETEKVAEVGSAVEVELNQEPAYETEVTEKLVEVGSAIKNEPKPEPESGVEETEKSAEVGSSVELEPIQHTDTVVEETEKAEVIEEESKVIGEEDNGQTETGSSVDVEPELVPEPVVEAAGTTEAEERNVTEDALAVNSASENLLFENGVAGKSSANGDAPTDQPSGQFENGSTDSAAETNEDSLKVVPNGEARDIPLENSESPRSCNVTEKALVEEVNCSTDCNHVELQVSCGDTVPFEPETDISGEGVEPHLSCSVKDTEMETRNSDEEVETNKDVPTDGVKLESGSGNESGSDCMVSSVEGDRPTNKDTDEEHSHEQAQAADITEAPAEARVVRRHPVYMIKVPRFINDELQKDIQDAQAQMQKKTEDRDSKGTETRKHAEVVKKYYEDYQAELTKEKDARQKFNGKRKELETIQQAINVINNANSITDIDEKIRNMVHRQQHETISLKEEKQYIHDINQMKRLREQLSSKKPSNEQTDEAFGKKDEIEARFKDLKKELEQLRSALTLAESSAKSAWDKYKTQEKLLKDLKGVHNAAGEVRQEAYLHWRKLREQSSEKDKHFRAFRADQSAATNYIFSGDNQGLITHCSGQVERIMDIWNNNLEFRQQYVKSNMYSTLKRLGTPDGRSLGPGESAPILRFHVDRSSKPTSAPSSKKETQPPVLASEVKKGNVTESPATKQVVKTNQPAISKSSGKLALVEGIVPVSNGEETKEDDQKKKLRKEQEEQARKAEELARKEEELRKERAAKEEELMKEKAAAELKERLRLEQRAKAKEAEERKRRKAEKAQAKAEYRAQKEAELKELKKAKKGSKKSGKADTMSNGSAEAESNPVPETNQPETSQEPETSPGSVSKKRSSKTPSSVRQYNKVQVPVPPPLRNKGKRRMRQWMWALLAVLLVISLFFAGNYISFSTSSLPDFGF